MPATPKQTTILWLQFSGPNHFVILKVDHLDDNVFVSELIEVSLENGPNNATTDSIVEFDGWATCFWQDKNERFYVGTVDGEIVHLSSEGVEPYILSERGITQIKGTSPDHAIATAIDGSVHQWDGTDWSLIDTGSQPALFAVEPLDGPAFAFAGEDGKLVMARDGNFDEIDCATNLRLTALDRINSDLFISADKGLAFRMAPGDELSQIEGATESVFGFVEFKGQIYAAGTAGGVLILEDNELNGFSDIIQSYGLAENGTYLATFGNDEVAVFDGKDWFQIAI